ncbi:hypothetical protein C3747_4g428 [Trypanosoma cruzi]|uniref:Uncharacterized protein n=2 Tax=Trypanosoma cruzi TaxID=5693 RepID=Q4D9F3_TRYCC|nr:hypothetical protein Tc00.1047053508979.40 [Trypanosoma cruzi]EAN89152.1 hypothetical protein Tc00.1047053508979.40 [Trypanosoma cruzi]PWV21073.1 hypothetical protein C3747_4g428 [Trypanosoma cruzi]RNC43193.1 hypothetical protein TcCL_NonESM07106 [Trypanosoma cruzi]|eukprot:XP_811003.1 hypothetical protein [Trypanosoma cruzi strain CL Brener]
MADESCFVAFASYIAKNAPCRRLTGCLHSEPFEALFCFIQGDATIIMAAPSLNGFECDNTNDGKESDEDYGDDLHRGADYLRVLAHESREGLDAVPTIPGLEEPLAFALSPAVISAPCVEADPFTVEFTQQLSSVCAAGPALAHSHVFQRCLADDLMCVVQAAASSFLLLPNNKHFALRRVFVCVAVDARGDAQRVCLLFGGHEGDFGVCRQHRESLRRRMEAKIRGVCLLHLSRQLRGTPDAQSEWMYAAQLGRPVFFSALRCRGNRESTAPLPAAFYCWGSTVLKLLI